MIGLAYIPGLGFLDRLLHYDEIKPGVLERIPTTQPYPSYWRLRVKRRGSGHTWRRLRELPKPLKAEALLLGVTLN